MKRLNKLRLIVALVVGLGLLFPVIAWTAATATLAPQVKFTAMDSNGDPYVGGKLYTYETGTSTLKTSWVDSTKVTPNTNPIVLDSRGQADVWIDSSGGAYRFKLHDVDDVTIWTKDNINDLTMVGSYSVLTLPVKEDSLIVYDDSADEVKKLTIYSLLGNVNFPDYNEVDQGVTGSGSSAKAFADIISTDNSTMVFRNNSGSSSTTYTFSTNWTSLSNINIIIEKGALISIATGVTVTVSSAKNISALPGQQIFSGLGDVAFTTQDGIVYSSWFETLEKMQESDAEYFVINAGYSISAVVDFDQDCTFLEFIGDGKVSTTDDTVHGITISGDKCKLIRPYLEGPGTYIYDGSTEASLIYVTGNDCEIISPRIVNPPSHGIYGNASHRIAIRGGSFNTTATNATPGTDTWNDAIKLKASEDVEVTGVYIYGEITTPTGFTEGIKISDVTSERPNVHHNHIQNCFDHAIYGGGIDEDFSHNQITSLQPGSGSAIVGQRSNGQYCFNIIKSIGGGITVRDANNSTVSHNDIEITATSGSPKGITLNVHTSGDLEKCDASTNQINFSGTSSNVGIEAITNAAGEVLNDIKIIHNTITDACQDGGDGAIIALSHAEGENVSILDNTIRESGVDGIVMTYLKNSKASNNTLIDIATRAFDLTDINDSTFALNEIVDEVGGVTNTVFRESDSATTCANNRYINNNVNCSGLANSSYYDLVGNNFTAKVLPVGKTWALASATTNFYIGSGFIHFVDPQANGRDFNPAGDWPTPCIITVINTADAAEQIDFDQAVLNQAILQNQRGIFGFDGTIWYKIYVGS